MRFDVHNFQELYNAVDQLANEVRLEHKTIVMYDGFNPVRFDVGGQALKIEPCDERGVSLNY